MRTSCSIFCKRFINLSAKVRFKNFGKERFKEKAYNNEVIQ